ncbi:MAG: SDR family oxidoreductase [Chloroflexi bacterium]|nr:SDR family oxidoreductase [Chloroflexota bacterium]
MLEKLSLDGKTIVVTGGGTGLGREMVRHLARAGADLVIAARRPGPIEEAAAEVRQMGRRALAITTDATASSQVNQMVQRILAEFGKIDVLVNNAGGGDVATPIWDITDEQWHKFLDINLTSAFYCSRAVAKHMADRGKGRIINIASGYGLRGGRDNFMYTAGKGGTVNLTRCMAISLSRYGITTVAIAPGFFPTIATRGRSDVPARGDYIPMGRVGLPEELGPVVVMLASDATSYFNGEVFYADGGGLAGGAAPTGYAPEIPLPVA